MKLKPSASYGDDAEIATSFGCTPSFSSAPWETLNNGTTSELNYAMWTYGALGCGNGTQRSLIRFKGLDTTSIPLSSIISVKLNLFGVSSSGNWGTSYFVGSPYPLTNEGWVERVTGSWTESVVTWNIQPTTTATNRAAIGVSASRFNWNTSIDVTTIVNDIIASGTNNGFLLRLNTEGIYRRVTFASSDYSDSTRWPELVITYLDDPCAGTTADFKDTNTSCYTFDFTDLSVPKDSGIVSWNWDFGDLTTSTLKNPTHTYADYGTYNVRLIVWDSGGCTDTITKAVTINYSHFANAGKDTTICLNNGLASTILIGAGGISYRWSPTTGLISPTAKNTTANITAAATYYLTVTNAFGCKDIDTVNINLHPVPIINNKPKDTSVCSGANLQLNASGVKTYQWSPASELDSPNKSNPTVVNIINPKTLIVMGTDANGCIAYDTIKIKLNPSVTVSVTPQNLLACSEDTVDFVASGALSYKWYPSEGLSNDSIANPKHHVTKSQTYIVKGKSAAGCEGVDSITVNIYPSPKVDAYAFANENIVRCKGDEVTISATGASTYSWSPAEFCAFPGSSSTSVYPTKNTVFTVTGTNDNGCKATDTISVIYEGKEKVYVPNVFTPNNDQINDKIGIVDECNIVLLSFDIYNRWGQNVYSGYNISDKWDGNYNGKPCDLGTYFYLIKARTLEGQSVEFKGDITLMR
ncbi:MAG: DNRLRE domain-containing protein [Bacteroidota bacterium]